MNEIESILARNVGNRITHELAAGMLASIGGVVERMLAAARGQAAQGPAPASADTDAPAAAPARRAATKSRFRKVDGATGAR